MPIFASVSPPSIILGISQSLKVSTLILSESLHVKAVTVSMSHSGIFPSLQSM